MPAPGGDSTAPAPPERASEEPAPAPGEPEPADVGPAPAAGEPEPAPTTPVADVAAENGHQPAEDGLEELTARAAKAEEYLGLAQRTKADFENFRKRAERDKAQAQERGIARLAKELLPAIDNLDRAVQAAEKWGPPTQSPASSPGGSPAPEAAAPQATAPPGPTAAPEATGPPAAPEATGPTAAPADQEDATPSHEAQLHAGLQLVHAEVLMALARVGIQAFSPQGEAFDPTLHEAVAQTPIPGTASGTVVEVYQQGYRLGDLVLRPARVLVAA